VRFVLCASAQLDPALEADRPRLDGSERSLIFSCAPLRFVFVLLCRYLVFRAMRPWLDWSAGGCWEAPEVAGNSL